MRPAKVTFVLSLCLLLLGCSSTPASAPPLANRLRSYNGTASVGDFLTISIDPAGHTITYSNQTNGETGTVPYTVNADGSYTITDTKGNLLAAYEVPGFVLEVEAANAGPKNDTDALITAVESAPASIMTFAGRSFNYIQFRTSSGGVEIGTVTIDAQGNIQHDGYSPNGVMPGQQYFHGGEFTASGVQEDPSGNFFTIHESNGYDDVVFGTQNGLWAVDTGAGAILGLPKAVAKDFDPTHAGTYNAIFYQKSNAQTGQGNIESGTPLEGKARVAVTAAGTITISDGSTTLASGTLVPVADTANIYDGTQNTLADPCFGMFTFRTATAASQQDVFVSFQGKAAIFSSFTIPLPVQPGSTYAYFYGVGLK